MAINDYSADSASLIPPSPTVLQQSDVTSSARRAFMAEFASATGDRPSSVTPSSIG